MELFTTSTTVHDPSWSAPLQQRRLFEDDILLCQLLRHQAEEGYIIQEGLLRRRCRLLLRGKELGKQVEGAVGLLEQEVKGVSDVLRCRLDVVRQVAGDNPLEFPPADLVHPVDDDVTVSVQDQLLQYRRH